MDGFAEVTDPELLQQLDGGQPAPGGLAPVEDLDLLKQLDADKADTSWAQRGRQFVAGAVEPFAALPESAAITAASAERKAGGTDVAPAQESDLYKFGQSIRDTASSVVGAPDKRDDSFMGQIAYGAGNIVGMGGSAIASSLAGGPWTGLAVGGIQGAAMNQAQVYKEAVEAGVDEQTAVEAADWAALVGASEIIPVGRALKLLPAKVRKEVASTVMKRVIELGKNGAEEGIQEFLSQVGNNIVAQKYYDPERGWSEGATEAALVGAILGTGTGAVGQTIESVSEKGADPAQSDALKNTGTPRPTASADVDPAITQAVSETPITPSETPRERAMRIAKERDQRAKAAPTAEAPAETPTETPAETSVTPEMSQPSSFPSATAATEPPAASPAAPAAPPVSEAPAETPAAEALVSAPTTDEAPKRSDLFDKGVEMVRSYNNASLGFLTGRLQIGDKRARKLLFELEDAGIISKPNERGIRTVIRDEVTPEGNQANPDTNTVQESDATLNEQRAALTEGKRRAVFYPDGTKPASKADGPNIKRIKVEGTGIFDYDATKITPKELREAAKAGRLNDVLDLGPVNKEEAAESAAAGNPPVAVVERTPEGTEVKAAAGTMETAPDQVTALEATKAAPENTVATEAPEQVIAERVAAPSEAQSTPPAKPRVLEDVSPEGIAKRKAAEAAAAELERKRAEKEQAAKEAAANAAAREAENSAKAEELNQKLEEQSFGSIEEEALARAQSGGSNLQTVEKAAIVKGASIAKDVFDKAAAGSLPEVVGDTNGINQVREHLKQVLALARNGFIQAQREARVASKGKLTEKEARALSIRDKAEYATVTGHNVWLSEVQNLARRIDKTKSDKGMAALIADINDFLQATQDLKNGSDKALRDLRQEKGAVIKAGKASDATTDRAELAGPGDMTFQDSVRDEENAAGGRQFDTAADTEASTASPDTQDVAQQVAESYEEAGAKRARRWREVRDLRREAAGKTKKAEPRPEPKAEEPSYSTPVPPKKPVFETKKKRTLFKSGEGSTYAPLDESAILQTVTFSEALAQSNEIKGSSANRSIINRLLTQLSKKIGQIDIHIVPQDALDAMHPDDPPGAVEGYYDPAENYIVISEKYVATGQFDARLLAHEGVHAYLSVALELDKKLKLDFEEILKYVRSTVTDPDSTYGLSNVHEMLAEALSNPEFQNLLMQTKVPDALAAKYDTPVGTMWQVFVDVVRKHLGFGRNDLDALSYVMRLGDRIETRASKLTPKERRFFGQAIKEGLLSKRDFGAELRAAGVPNDVAKELHDFINEELGKAIDPSTLPLLMGDLIREYGKPVTSAGNGGGAAPPAGGATSQQAPAPKTKPTGQGSWLRRQALKLNTLDYIRQTYNGYFDGLLDPYVKTHQKREAIVSEVSEKHDRDAADFTDLMRNNRDEAVELANIAMEATRLNVQVGPNGKNEHLGKNARRGLQGKKALADLNARYVQLSPEAQNLYQRMISNYRETHANNVRALAYNILTSLDLKNRMSNDDLKLLMDKTANGTLTQADADLIGEPDLFKELRGAFSLKTIKGDYFPQMRFGDHVVLTVDKIENPNVTSVTLKGKKGKKGTPGIPGQTVPVKSWVDGDTVRFQIDPSVRGTQIALQRLVSKYIEDSDLTLIRASKRFIDKKTGEIVSAGEQRSDRDYDIVMEVKFQTQGVSFFEKRADAEKFRAQAKKAGGLDGDPSEVLDRRTDIMDKLIHDSALTNITKRIEARKDLPAWQKKQMRNAVQAAIISQMPGNRAQSRHMARRNVKGASSDIARAAVTYGQSAGNYYATLTLAPDIRKAFDAIDKYDSANKMKDGGGVRSQVMNELRLRQESMDDPLYTNKHIQNVATLSFLDKLAGPSHSIINAAQVISNALPYLGGKHGNVRAAMAIGSAYRKMGVLDVVKGAGRNTYTTAKGFQKSWIDTEDLVGSVRKKLGPKYAALLDDMGERGLLENESGFEIGPAIAAGSDPLSISLAKVDRIARQAPAAVEVINRVVTAVAAYDLATSQGNNRLQAIEEAYNVVSMTQGDYRSSNNPRFMRDPKLAWAMQFKKYAVLQTQLYGDMYVRAFKGASIEERKIAAKQLANMMAVQTMLAGAMGLPGLEIIKVGLSFLSILVPDMGWDDQEERLKKLLDESIGKGWSELLRKGVVTRALGIDVSDRMSQADLWSGFVPDKLDRSGLMDYAGSLVLGAPGSTLFDWFDAGRKLWDADIVGALEKAVPIKILSDTVTAVKQYSNGKMNAGDAVAKVVGFKSARQARIQEDRDMDFRQKKRVKEESNALFKEYINATSSGELIRLKARIREFNASQPKNGRKLSIKSLEKLRQKELARYRD